MCKVSTFVTGVCVGMVAGALVEVMVIPRPKTRKTAVGKAMQRMGNAVDSALETVAEKMNGGYRMEEGRKRPSSKIYRFFCAFRLTRRRFLV